MKQRMPTLDLYPDEPPDTSATTWFVQDVMETGPWVISGRCSARDRTKLLFDIAKAAMNGEKLLAENGPAAQKVLYVNYSKSEAASARELRQAGLAPGDMLAAYEPPYAGAQSFTRDCRKFLPNGGLVLVDGVTGSIFGSRAEVLEFLEIAVASVSSDITVIVSLPDDLAGARSVQKRNERFLKYANMLSLNSDKGELNLEVFGHEAGDSKYFDFESHWLPNAGRNELNPTDAAVVAYLYSKKEMATNREILLHLEPHSGTNTAEADDGQKPAARINKVLQRLELDDAVVRDPKRDGYYCHPLFAPPRRSEAGSVKKESDEVVAPVVGGQPHPESAQEAGAVLLTSPIDGLADTVKEPAE